MNVQEYLREKILEFNEKYNAQSHLNAYSDRYLKQQWKEDSKCTQGIWQSVQSVSDVKNYINGFVGTVKQYENVQGLFSDAYDMDLALYKALIAVRKMAQCFDMDEFDFHSFSKVDIDKMFEELCEGVRRMKNVNMCRMMQD